MMLGRPSVMRSASRLLRSQGLQRCARICAVQSGAVLGASLASRHRWFSSEIASILESRLKEWKLSSATQDEGLVLSVGDGIAKVYGLDEVEAGELVSFEGGAVGLALNLERGHVGVVLLSEQSVGEGTRARRTKKIAEIETGSHLLGRVVNALGEPIDGGPPLGAAAGPGAPPVDTSLKPEARRIEIKAPGIMSRGPINKPLLTGLSCVDALIPIGMGQRELIIGDRQTGKTAVALDAMLNQHRLNAARAPADRVACVYVSIGQKQSTVAALVAALRAQGALESAVFVCAGASEGAALQFLAPFAACAIAERFRDAGRHALIVYDDLTKHANAYRQLSLLLRRPPGREAYPGDVFYLHSRLLERAGQLSDKLGGGSLTALPIVETQGGDMSAYIPTNVISITDGQVFLETELFNKGVRPAVNVGLSVSRVGAAAQTKAMRAAGGSAKLELAQHREVAAFAQFGSDLDAQTRRTLARGDSLVALFKQNEREPRHAHDQALCLWAATRGHLDAIVLAQVPNFVHKWPLFVEAQNEAVYAKIRDEHTLEDDVLKALDGLITEYFKVNPANPR